MCVPCWARCGNMRPVFAHMGYPFVGGRMDGAGLRCVWKIPAVLYRMARLLRFGRYVAAELDESARAPMVMSRPMSAPVRWEMEMTVRLEDARRRACRTACSISASRLAVISSSSLGSAATAQAMDNSCHWPWEKVPGVQGVSYPCSRPLMASYSPASRAAARICSSVMEAS